MDASTSSHSAGGSPRFIDGGDIELVSVIGTGAYGVVYLAIDARYGQPVYRAVKCLRRKGLDARQRHFQRREITLHRLASAHPSIITMDRVIQEGDHLYVVMDYGDEGDLFAMITDKQRYVGFDELIRDVFVQLVDGVQWLHHLGIAHRDIKPENIVCSDDGTRLRICDFGLATSEVESDEFGCGSTFYIAPESLGDWYPGDNIYPTRHGDVWSLGVILVNLVCGRNPWRIASPTDESFNAFLADPNFLRRILPLSEQCLFILTKIFTVDPYQRISLVELRKLILEVETFTMDEEELRLAHAAAGLTTPAITTVCTSVYEPVQTRRAIAERMGESHEWSQETVFAFEKHETAFTYEDLETPSLRADSGSPSPPAHRSRSGSPLSSSLPPTPLLGSGHPNFLSPPSHLWQILNPTDTLSFKSELRINPTSPDSSSATAPNPFFR